jgi:hypothetical protein
MLSRIALDSCAQKIPLTLTAQVAWDHSLALPTMLSMELLRKLVTKNETTYVQ